MLWFIIAKTYEEKKKEAEVSRKRGEGRGWGVAGRNQKQASKSLHRVVMQDALNSSARTCDNKCEPFPRETPVRLNAWGFYWELLK